MDELEMTFIINNFKYNFEYVGCKVKVVIDCMVDIRTILTKQYSLINNNFTELLDTIVVDPNYLEELSINHEKYKQVLNKFFEVILVLKS